MWMATYFHKKLSTFVLKIYVFYFGKHVDTRVKIGLRAWHSDILDDISLENPNIHDIFEDGSLSKGFN